MLVIQTLLAALVLAPQSVERGEPTGVKCRSVQAEDCRAEDFPSISAAVVACAEKGGGRVVVGRGEHRSDGPVVLRSNVELHLEEGATACWPLRTAR